MRLRLPSALPAVAILTLLLVPAVALAAPTVVRLILALPLLLVFPGYALIEAVFGQDTRTGLAERVALSCVTSLAVVALIGWVLNFTPWGVTLWPGLAAVAGFVLLADAVALVRRARSGLLHWTGELRLNLPQWRATRTSRLITGVLGAAVLASVAALGYAGVALRHQESYTEFYVLGLNGRAQDYPTDFVISGGRTTQVSYGSALTEAADSGWVTLGIVNHENKTVAYSVSVSIGSVPVNVNYGGAMLPEVGNIVLNPGLRWEGSITFAPVRTGDNQTVDFFLFEDGAKGATDSLRLWINARAADQPQ